VKVMGRNREEQGKSGVVIEPPSEPTTSTKTLSPVGVSMVYQHVACAPQPLVAAAFAAGFGLAAFFGLNQAVGWVRKCWKGVF
jgi:hypothetical protein